MGLPSTSTTENSCSGFMKIDLAIGPFEAIVLTELEAFVDDLEIAGSSVEALEEALGISTSEGIQRAHRAYLELLLKLNDGRHEIGVPV